MRRIAVLLLFVVHLGSAQRMAITLDDAPFGFSGGMTDQEKIEAFDKIMDILERFNVKATFFVTSSNMTDSTQVILDKAKSAGHQLGNHTHGHLDLNKVSAEEYMKDISTCAKEAREWINSNYFRYSYLRQGNSHEKKKAVHEYLKQEGLRIAPVTIDNNEWVYNSDFLKAKNRNQKMTVADAYLRHMMEVTEKYRSMGVELMGREVDQILLLHVNPINALYLDELLTMYKEGGWQFIPLDEAMQDTIYQMPDDYIGEQGISVLDRIRLSR